MSFKSIKIKIALIMTIVLLIATIAIIFARSNEIRSRSMAFASERLLNDATMNSVVLDKMLENAWVMVNSAHDLPQVQATVRGGSRQEAEDALDALYRNTIEIDGELLYASYLVLDAEFYIAALAFIADIPPGWNAADTPYTENLRQAQMGNSWISDVTLSPISGLAQVWLSRPIMEGNTMLGVMVIPLHTHGLDYFLSSQPYQDGNYYSVIADNSGIVAYSNRPGYLGKSIVDLGIAPNMTQLPQNVMFEYYSTEAADHSLAHLIISDTGWVSITGIVHDYVLPTISEITLGTLPIVLGLLLFGAIIFFTISKIIKPIGLITNELKNISEGEGDLTRQIKINSKDEIGLLALYYNETIGKIRQMILSTKGEAYSLSQIGEDLSNDMTETATAMNEITVNLQNIKSRMISQSASVSETNSTMEQITVNINKLNEHVEKQASSVAAGSSAIEQMVANINSVTHTLVNNSKNVEELTSASEIGRTGLQEVAADIQEISRESEGLLEINTVMQNIASQTNLLSMNAAIEAAHAGESGKGFAVVADEIRKLAENSSEQSKTISTVLKKIKSSIDKITQSTDKVLQRFEAIDSSIRTVAEQEENIRNSMEEQGEGSKQILVAVGLVNDTTQIVKGISLEMLEGAKEVIREGDNLEKVTQEIIGGVNEMATGAEQINTSIHNVNNLSNKNRECIVTLTKDVMRFKVD
ncbi:MAG: methyl-accepting chemotaxis protein [Treponema sp.]|nr:methyl-accepting chemotaxis protein [Treponema sp.]